VRYLAASLLIISYFVLCWTCWRSYWRRQAIASTNVNEAGDYLLVGYASQGGSATRIAQKTALQLERAGKAVKVLPLNQITPELLVGTSTVLFIASTYGEGEAPDNGNRFIARTLGQLPQHSLQHQQVAILGLGDSSYKFFCGFAHQLQCELQHRGAHFISDIVEVNLLDESALRHWQYYLGQISGRAHFIDWSAPAYSEWKIVQRICINPGSPGAPVFHIKLAPLDAAIAAGTWQAGDIAEIGPGNCDERIQRFLEDAARDTISPKLLRYSDLSLSEQRLAELTTCDDAGFVSSLADLPQREYSIASDPTEGSIDLLVRQVNHGIDQYGLGSGWLTVHAAIAQPVRLRIRANVHFHSPDNQCPLILIGNGTGIAGLRAHLANPARTNTRNWLFFGERTAAADNFFDADLQRWKTTGRLTRMDRVFSRDAGIDAPRYVQDLLQLNAAELQRWVAEGAAIFVCGSLQGMARAVDDVLRNIIGAEQLELMADERRYCRDVY
jgi:sulfite reductase (NADPH) flavoprotein alpha-component